MGYGDDFERHLVLVRETRRSIVRSGRRAVPLMAPCAQLIDGARDAFFSRPEGSQGSKQHPTGYMVSVDGMPACDERRQDQGEHVRGHVRVSTLPAFMDLVNSWSQATPIRGSIVQPEELIEANTSGVDQGRARPKCNQSLCPGDVIWTLQGEPVHEGGWLHPYGSCAASKFVSAQWPRTHSDDRSIFQSSRQYDAAPRGTVLDARQRCSRRAREPGMRPRPPDPFLQYVSSHAVHDYVPTSGFAYRGTSGERMQHWETPRLQLYQGERSGICALTAGAPTQKIFCASGVSAAFTSRSLYRGFVETIGLDSGGFSLFGYGQTEAYDDLIAALPNAILSVQRYFRISSPTHAAGLGACDYCSTSAAVTRRDAPIVKFEETPDFDPADATEFRFTFGAVGDAPAVQDFSSSTVRPNGP